MSETVYESVRDIPIPDDGPVNRDELIAFQEALGQLETEWRQLQANENPDQKMCLKILEEKRAKRRQLAEERLRLRLEVIDKQVERETERIQQEAEEAKKILWERLVRAYAQAYQHVTAQLKELMGKARKDYQAYMADKTIEFPIMQSDSTMKTRMQQPEEMKIKLSPQDCERDLMQIQALFEHQDD